MKTLVYNTRTRTFSTKVFSDEKYYLLGQRLNRLPDSEILGVGTDLRYKHFNDRVMEFYIVPESRYLNGKADSSVPKEYRDRAKELDKKKLQSCLKLGEFKSKEDARKAQEEYIQKNHIIRRSEAYKTLRGAQYGPYGLLKVKKSALKPDINIDYEKNKKFIVNDSKQSDDVTSNNTQETKSDTWFILYDAHSSRDQYFGWTAVDKSSYTRSDAKELGKRMAKRLGESKFNYYYSNDPVYITDSLSAFKAKCEKINFHPNLSEYE